MESILKGAGYFVYPLGVFSFLAVFIMVERFIALWPSRVMSEELAQAFVSGEILDRPDDLRTSAGRIVYFFRRTNADADALKAFARLEIARLERGLFILDIVFAGAPLLGLLGTIVGLSQVFSNQVANGAIPNPSDFGPPIALALSTTMLGLCIAIPALIGNSYLNRRVDLLAARLEMGVERLIDLAKKRAAAPSP